jgi:ribosomal protein S18 acetylase RimI-like enzyme
MLLNIKEMEERMQIKTGIYTMNALSQAILIEIEALANACNVYEQLDLKLNWNMLRSRPRNETNDFLYYDQGELVGYLALFSFNAREAEVSGMVLPQRRRQGIFTTLLEAARKECRQRRLPALLFIIEHTSASGQSLAISLHSQYEHSEYKMILEKIISSVQFSHTPLQFRQAQPEDIPALKHITAVSFGMPDGEVDWYTEKKMHDLSCLYYVAFVDDICVGKIDVIFRDREAFILGFGVLPAYQRRGYGRQILLQTLQMIQKKGDYQVMLEVESKNEHALELYLSCGFKQTARYDYYQLAIPLS